MRSTVVEAADQAATSSRGKKVEAAAAAKPSMRSPRVTRSSSSPSANGACCKPAVGAWARPHTLCIQAQLLVPRLRLHSFLAELHPRAPSWDPLAKKRGTTSATFALAPFAGCGATRATVVATDATREQHEEQSAEHCHGSPSAVPSSDAGAPSAAVSNRARRADRRRWLSLLRHHLRARCIPIHPTSHQPSTSPRARLRCHRLSSTDTPTIVAVSVFSLDPSVSVRFRRGDPSGDGAPA